MAGVEGLVLGEVVLVPDPGRVDDRVEDQAVDPVGVQLGVHRAQVGAVGVAEVAELVRAQGGAQHLEVTGGRDRADVREHVRVLGLAGLGEGLHPLQVGPLGLLVQGYGIGPHGCEVPGAAVQDGLALADAPGIEADHVVLGGHVLGQRGGDVPGQGAAAAAGAARVDQQRALGAGGRVGDPGQGECDLPAAGTVVVEGDLERGALERRIAGGRAVRPLQGGGRGRGGGRGGGRDRARERGGDGGDRQQDGGALLQGWTVRGAHGASQPRVLCGIVPEPVLGRGIGRPIGPM